MDKKTKDLSKSLFEKLGIKQTADLLGRKMGVSFYHKLGTDWHFIELCFVINSCTLEVTHGFAYINFPWVPISKKESVFLSIMLDNYLIQYRSPVTADKPVQDEIQEFASDIKTNELSRATYKLL